MLETLQLPSLRNLPMFLEFPLWEGFEDLDKAGLGIKG